ncbi:Peroxisomal adenine nucleotide carrier 1 [Vitis vinifera]|uniref:Peroxisomal adenine nucleotide carrier 1 n=1 Tax=Vitis vinifera TaxID=29760 RepID=A0A438HCS3_VITVI|nr:Peroxisomal adenine nucleotide carrier 1 [Vitis vinifera]
MVNSGLEIPNAGDSHANTLHASADVDMNSANTEDQTELIGPASEYEVESVETRITIFPSSVRAPERSLFDTGNDPAFEPVSCQVRRLKLTDLQKAGGLQAAPLPAIFIGENLESPNCLWIGIIAYKHPEHVLHSTTKKIWQNLTAGNWNEASDGLGISLLLTTNPAIQYTAFDQLKRRRLKRNHNITEKGSSLETLSALSAFMLGAMSKSIVSNLVTPQNKL